MVNVAWMKNGSSWYNLSSVDLQHNHFDGLGGVYIIWHGGTGHTIVRVGQGTIRDRLTMHRSDAQILAYQMFGLFVTWASIPMLYRDGVERFLAEHYRPKVGDRFPNVPALEVNLPA